MTLVSSIANTLKQLQDKPVLYPLIKEVVGCNAPKTLVVRNQNEMLDVATGQFGGTLCFFGSGILLDRLLKPFYQKILTHPNLLPNPKAALEWTRLGKSFSIYSLQAALYWAVPFFRNFLTSRRSGTHNFIQMIGVQRKADLVNQQKLKEKQAYSLGMVRKIIIGGVIASALSVAASVFAIRKGLAINKTAAFLLKHLGLGGGSFKNYPRWAEFFFIAVASYVGWIHATRDKFELKEQMLQFGSFLFGWFVPPLAFERYYKGRLRQLLNNKPLFEKVIGVNASMLNINHIRQHLASRPLLKRQAEALFVSQTLFSLGTSIVLLSVLPQLCNIYLTQRRVARAKSRLIPPAVLPPSPQLYASH